MNEPIIPVNVDQILAILGAKEVELQMTRNMLSQAQAELAQLKAKSNDAPSNPAAKS